MEEKLLKTIDNLCTWINKRLESDNDCLDWPKVTEMTKALAELVAAKRKGN